MPDSKIKTDEKTGERYFDLEPGHMKYAARVGKRTQGKGDGRRPEDRQAIERNWPFKK